MCDDDNSLISFLMIFVFSFSQHTSWDCIYNTSAWTIGRVYACTWYMCLCLSMCNTDQSINPQIVCKHTFVTDLFLFFLSNFFPVSSLFVLTGIPHSKSYVMLCLCLLTRRIIAFARMCVCRRIILRSKFVSQWDEERTRHDGIAFNSQILIRTIILHSVQKRKSRRNLRMIHAPNPWLYKYSSRNSPTVRVCAQQ